MADRIVYVYGIVPASFALDGAPRGLDAGALSLVREGEVAALVSELDASLYPPAMVEASVGDVAWVSPRAVAHDAVLSWAGEAGDVVPSPMFTLFGDADAVRRMLRERASLLTRALTRVAGAREFAVRLFRRDEVLATRVAELSPALGDLEREARSATPGQRYLIERKADGQRSAEMRRVAQDVARECFDALRGAAREATRDSIAQRDGEPGVAVLNAFFLVPRDEEEPFRRELTALVRRHEPFGFAFEFTGPWPPYHFTRDDR
jgi:hypothetical protein